VEERGIPKFAALATHLPRICVRGGGGCFSFFEF